MGTNPPLAHTVQMTEYRPRAIAESLDSMPSCLLTVVQAYAVPTMLDIIEEILSRFTSDRTDWNAGLAAACRGNSLLLANVAMDVRSE